MRFSRSVHLGKKHGIYKCQEYCFYILGNEYHWLGCKSALKPTLCTLCTNKNILKGTRMQIYDSVTKSLNEMLLSEMRSWGDLTSIKSVCTNDSKQPDKIELKVSFFNKTKDFNVRFLAYFENNELVFSTGYADTRPILLTKEHLLNACLEKVFDDDSGYVLVSYREE